MIEGKQCTTGRRRNFSRYFTFSNALVALTEFIFNDEAIHLFDTFVAEGVRMLTISPTFLGWRTLNHGMMA